MHPFSNAMAIQKQPGIALLCVLLIIAITSGQVPTQQEVDYIAENLDIKYEVLYNRIINGTTWRYVLSLQRDLARSGQGVPTSLDILPPYFLARITLSNTGSVTIPAKSWDFYICHSLIEPAFYDFNTSSYVGGAILFPTVNATFVHIQGCMFKMTPYTGFQIIAPGQSMNFNITSQPWSVARSDVMPNWYVGGNGLQPKVIKSTAGNSLGFVQPFDNPEKWKRAIPEDLVFDPFPPQFRYQLNSLTDSTPTDKLVIPTPNGAMLNGRNSVTVGKNWVVFTKNADLKSEAEYLKAKLGVRVVNRNPGSGNVIVLQKRNLPNTNSPEAYRIQVQPNSKRITIIGQDTHGVFNGIQTLRSLVDNEMPIPGGTLNDQPRFHYRGVHIDVARNFHSTNQVIKMIDAMAMYKLNKLHLHLSDDEGWRLEIPGIPELVEVGSKRCHDPTQTKCIWPQLGSGPDTSTSGSGHYTVDEYKKILNHAKNNYIEVIPELEMPGRSRPAVAAMEARFLKYHSTNITKAIEYRLLDQNDTTNYLSRSTLTKNGAINPCMQSTYDFVKKVMAEVIEMHKAIQPLRVFHFGGDEAPPGAWTNSSACSDHISHNVDLKRLFTFQVAQLARSMGVVLGTWEDGVAGPTGFPYNLTQLGAITQVNAWNNIGEYGFARRAYDLANLGYQVVLSSATHLFIDHPQEPDPEEPGYYWATRFTNTSRVFKYLPGNITLNNDYGMFGQPLPGCGRQGLPPCPELLQPQNIIGMQCQIWSEVLRTPGLLEYQAFPRLLACAERAWHKARWEDTLNELDMWADYADFGKMIGTKELHRLDSMGFQYRVAPPGAVLRNGYLSANAEFPSQVPQVLTSNGNWTDIGSQLFVGNVRTPLTLRTRTQPKHGSRKYSRNVLMDPTLVLPTPEEIAAANRMQQQSARRQMHGQMPPGQMPPGRMPPGQMPPGQMPPGQMPPGRMPPGQMPPGQMPPGRMPPGQMPPGQMPPGRMPPGQMPPGRMPPGQQSAPGMSMAG